VRRMMCRWPAPARRGQAAAGAWQATAGTAAVVPCVGVVGVCQRPLAAAAPPTPGPAALLEPAVLARARDHPAALHCVLQAAWGAPVWPATAAWAALSPPGCRPQRRWGLWSRLVGPGAAAATSHWWSCAPLWRMCGTTKRRTMPGGLLGTSFPSPSTLWHVCDNLAQLVWRIYTRMFVLAMHWRGLCYLACCCVRPGSWSSHTHPCYVISSRCPSPLPQSP
jgi:hypothetical protein